MTRKVSLSIILDVDYEVPCDKTGAPVIQKEDLIRAIKETVTHHLEDEALMRPYFLPSTSPGEDVLLSVGIDQYVECPPNARAVSTEVVSIDIAEKQ